MKKANSTHLNKDPLREQQRLERRYATLEATTAREESECQELFAVLRRAVGNRELANLPSFGGLE